nr:MAG: RNA-dependent RNA polymerase [Crogonang virus 70]
MKKIVDTEVERLDISKVIACKQCAAMRVEHPDLHFCPHSQVFDRYDMFTDEPLEVDLSYSDVVKQLYAYDRKLCASEKQKLRSYDMLIENPTLYDNANFDPDFKFEMNEEELFVDTMDHVSAGALDMRVPTDVAALHEMVVFMNYLTSVGIHDVETREQELANHPALYATYHRRVHCGIVHGEMATDLVSAMKEAGIQYNHEEKQYQFKTGLRQNWKNVYNSFSKWCANIAQQVAHIWSKSGIEELIGVIYMGLTMLSMVGLSYAFFKGFPPECQQCGFHYESKTECNEVKPEVQIPIKTLEEWMKMYNTENPEATVKQTEDFKNKIKKMIEKQHALNCALNDVFVTEISDSTAPPPRKTNNFRVEVSDSTAPPPRKTNNFKVEFSDSTAPPPRKTTNFRVESSEETANFKAEMYSDGGCQAVESKIINKSLYAIHSDSAVYGNVMFVQGTTFLMNAHFAEYFRTLPQTMKLYLTSCQGRLAEFTVGEVVKNHILLSKNNDRADAVLVPLDNRSSRVSAHPSIINLFIKQADLSLYTGKYNVQLPSYARSSTDFFVPTARSLVDMQYKDLQETISSDSYKMKIAHAWTYLGSTADGDCGAPLIINENSSIRKIVGIHMGSRVLPDKTQGTGQIITQEMIIAGLEKAPMRAQYYTQIDMPITEVERTEMSVGHVPLGAGLFVHGTTNMSTSSGGNTKLQPSKLHGIVTPLTMPAQLKATKESNPMMKGLMKFGKEVPMINPTIIGICANDVANNLRLNVTRLDFEKYQRILSYEEAVQGVEGDTFLAAINRGTSMGFPFAVLYHNPHGKRMAYGEDEWTMDSPLALEIKAKVLELEENCRKGIQTGVYWADTLKDERRPIEKVLQGKTRVFCGGPVHFTILFRKYFLGFAAWIMHNRNANEIATGTNVYSADWNEIVYKLASRGKTKDGMNIVAGDFANFDGSLSSQILWYILDLINEWYDDGEENAKIRHYR